MKKQNILLLILFLFLVLPFLFNIFNSGGEGYYWSLWDAITLIVVNIGGILLFLLTFQNTKLCSKNFFIYKLICLQEIFIMTGLWGSILGFISLIMAMEVPPPPGVDPTAITISNIAITILCLIYGFTGALITYMIQKYHEMQSNDNYSSDIEKPKEGLKIFSLIYFIIYLTLNISAISILSANSGNIKILPFESIYYIAIITIILILFYKGNSLFNLLKDLFWYIPDTNNNIKYNLQFIRNVKKIFAMIICISLLCAPIMMLVVLTMPPQESNILDFNTLSFSGLKHGGIQFFWILSTIILLTIMEGREATKLYYLTGQISSGDRFYSIKYILGPAFLIFFIFIIGIIQSLLF